MKVSDIVTVAAQLINEEDIVGGLKDYSNATDSARKKIELMVTLFNLEITELAGSFIPMKKTQRFCAAERKAEFKDFDEKVLEILAVYGANGEKINYELHPTELVVSEEEFTVSYSYIPAAYDINAVIGYDETEIPEGVLAYGLAAEYLLTERRFTEAVAWHARFEKAVKNLCAPENVRTKNRAWR